MQKNKITHSYICDVCGKPATRNTQEWIHEYSIKGNGDFKETDSWEGQINEFYCDDCSPNDN